jgi:hypothetical protein
MSNTDRRVYQRGREFGDDVFLARHPHRWRGSITCRVDRAALFRRLAFPDLMTKTF